MTAFSAFSLQPSAFQGASLAVIQVGRQSPPGPNNEQGPNPGGSRRFLFFARRCPISPEKSYMSCRGIASAARMGWAATGQPGSVRPGRSESTCPPGKRPADSSQPRDTFAPARRISIKGSQRRWTQPGPDGHATGHGKDGTPDIASGGSPVTWGSASGRRPSNRRARRSPMPERPGRHRTGQGPRLDRRGCHRPDLPPTSPRLETVPPAVTFPRPLRPTDPTGSIIFRPARPSRELRQDLQTDPRSRVPALPGRGRCMFCKKNPHLIHLTSESC